MHNFEDYVDKANAATNPEELKQIFLSSLSQQGFDCVNLVFHTPHSNLNLDAGINIVDSGWQDFFTYYRDKGFEKIDPVLAYGKSHAHPFTWDFLFQKVHMSKKQAEVIYACQEGGFHHGVYFPMTRGHLHAGMGLASTCKDVFKVNHDLVSAYCHHFYDAFCRLNTKSEQDINEIFCITPKEIEILSLAAFGKTDSEIAKLLGISQNTVETHLRKSYVKLDANNRAAAVAKALARRYIFIDRM